MVVAVSYGATAAVAAAAAGGAAPRGCSAAAGSTRQNPETRMTHAHINIETFHVSHFCRSKQSKQTQAMATWHGSSQDGMLRRPHFTIFTLFTIYLQP